MFALKAIKKKRINHAVSGNDLQIVCSTFAFLQTVAGS
jgi:hypothetical protein